MATKIPSTVFAAYFITYSLLGLLVNSYTVGSGKCGFVNNITPIGGDAEGPEERDLIDLYKRIVGGERSDRGELWTEL